MYTGIRLALPSGLDLHASGESVAAEEGGADGPWWLPVPQHREITLAGYPVEGSVQAARVLVYPVEEFAATNAEAASRIETLRQLLQTQAAEPGVNRCCPLRLQCCSARRRRRQSAGRPWRALAR